MALSPGIRDASTNDAAAVMSSTTAPVEHESISEEGSVQAKSSGIGSRLAALAAPLMIAVIIQSIANLIYHAVVGRTLPPELYGALGTVLAAMTLVAVPLSALQTAAARATAEHGLTRQTAMRALTRTTLYTLPAVAIVALLAPSIQSFLHLGSLWDALILAPTLLVAALLAMGRGLLLGVDRVGVVATSYVISTIGRLGPGLALALTWGVTGALLGTLVGELAALLVILWPLLRTDGGRSWPVPASDLLRTGLVITGLFLSTTIDLFLARHFLAGQDSGLYVAAATLGKTTLALPAAAMSIVYPRLVKAWGTPQAFKTLRSGALVVGGPALAAMLVLVLMPDLSMTILFGKGTFADAETVVRLLAVVAGASAFVSVFTHAALARRGLNMIVPWIGAVLQIVAISIWHADAQMVALGSLAALTVTLLLQAIIEVPKWSRRQAGKASTDPALETAH